MDSFNNYINRLNKGVINIIKVERQEHETIDKLLQRFKQKINASNILIEYKERQYFISNGIKKRTKKHLAKRRKQRITDENA